MATTIEIERMTRRYRAVRCGLAKAKAAAAHGGEYDIVVQYAKGDKRRTVTTSAFGGADRMLRNAIVPYLERQLAEARSELEAVQSVEVEDDDANP